MTAFHAACRALPYRILLQGEKPKHRLLEEFKVEPSVLFATASFWEGVDVPGEALSLVVIDRLPFAPRQGFGRLVRTRADRGLVAVLDRRLVTKGYGRAFLATLPRCPLLRTVEEARRWWAA